MLKSIAALICLTAPCMAEPLFSVTATVSGIAGVKDGDGILFGKHAEIRLQGIAAPEYRSNRKDAGGFEADAALRRLAEGKPVVCFLDGSTAGGSKRPVGVCEVDGQDVGLLLVLMGVARDCPAFSGGRYATAEQLARDTDCE